MKQINGEGGEHPPHGTYVYFRARYGGHISTYRGYTATITNSPYGRAQLVFVVNNSRQVFFADQVVEWEPRLPSRTEFDQDALHYMPTVAGKGELEPVTGGVESAVIVDRTLTKEGQVYIWEWSNGRWSDDATLVERGYFGHRPATSAQNY